MVAGLDFQRKKTEASPKTPRLSRPRSTYKKGRWLGQ